MYIIATINNTKKERKINMKKSNFNGTWCCDRTYRHYRTVNVKSIDQRIKIKIIENIIYAKDTAYRMKIL